MSYKQYIHTRWNEGTYEDCVEWVKSKYEEYGDRIVFTNISPWNKASYKASVIVKDLPEPEQQKIQL